MAALGLDRFVSGVPGGAEALMLRMLAVPPLPSCDSVVWYEARQRAGQADGKFYSPGTYPAANDRKDRSILPRRGAKPLLYWRRGNADENIGCIYWPLDLRSFKNFASLYSPLNLSSSAP